MATSKNQKTQLKNRQKTWIDIFPRWTCREPTGTWKDAQQCYTSGKCKSKTKWAIISHLSEWLSSKQTQITNVDEDVKRREPSYSVGGDINWSSHRGKQ